MPTIRRQSAFIKLHQLAPLYFVFITLVAQIVAAAFFECLRDSTVSRMYPGGPVRWRYLCTPAGCFPLVVLLLPLWGACAWLVAFLFQLPRAWQILNFAVGPLSLLYLGLQLPAWPLLIPVILGILIYLPTFWTRVPYYPTSLPMYQAIATELPADKSLSFIDLGCGFGGLLDFLSRRCPQAYFYGVEIGFLPYLVSKLRFLRRHNVSIRLKSFWNFSLAPYDRVYAFLAPGPMPRLWEKARREMQPGSVLLVNSFPAPAAAHREIAVEDARNCRLFVYSMKGGA